MSAKLCFQAHRNILCTGIPYHVLKIICMYLLVAIVSEILMYTDYPRNINLWSTSHLKIDNFNFTTCYYSEML